MADELDVVALSERARLFTPIAGKCLGIASSDHHRCLKNLAGFDLDKQICAEMIIPWGAEKILSLLILF